MRWFGLTLALIALLTVNTSAFPRTRRDAELQEPEDLSPLDENPPIGDEDRDKRALEGITQAKWTAKNAVLGFVFGKINQLIDTKTNLINQLDKQNIAKNKQYGIVVPSSNLGSLGNIGSAFTSFIGPKLQLIGPKLNFLTSALGKFSGGSSSSDSSSGSSSGSGLGTILRIFSSLSGGSGGSGSVTINGSNTFGDVDDDDDDDDANETKPKADTK